MKKFLSLVLALVMTMSLVTVSAGAKEFKDDADVTYDEAVAVISEVGVVDGYEDGSFKPSNTLTRGAAAKIICNLILGPTTAAELRADTAPYKDVPVSNVFSGYIAYCAKEGIISGYADGSFRPAGTLTGYAFMKMLLGALGYDSKNEGYTGANWSIAVAKQAIGIGLNAGLTEEFNGVDFVTREEAALYAFNTLKATMVDYEQKITTTINGIDVVISQGNEKPVTWTQGKNNDGNIKEDGFVQFAEEFFPDLVRKDDSTKFEEPANTWVNDKTEIGTFERTDLLVTDPYTTEVTGKDLYDLLKSGVIKDNDLEVYVDGVAAKGNELFDKDDIVRSNNEKLGATGNGVVTKVYLNTDKDLITVVSINTYLAKATADYNESKEYAPLNVYMENATGTNFNVDVEDVAAVADVKEDAFYQVNVSKKSDSKGEVVVLKAVEVLEDSTVTKFSTSDNKVSKLTVGGEEYKANVKAYYDDEILNEYNESLLTDNTYNVYVDENGYFIGVDLFEGTNNYVFITGYDLDGSHIAVKTATAAAIFTDGTMKTIKVNVSDTNDNIEAALNDGNKAAGKGYFTKWANGKTGGNNAENNWYTYTVTDEVYTLKPADRSTKSSAADASTIRTDSLFVDGQGANKARVYGEDATIFLTADTGDVSLPHTGDIGITEVTGVYTGVQSVEIEVEAEDAAAMKGNVFTVYDSDHYMIAAVVLGDAIGSNNNLAYILSGPKSEEYKDGVYYWEFDAVMDGVKKTFQAKSNYPNDKNLLDSNKYGVLELRFDGDYVTDLRTVDADKIYTYTDAIKVPAQKIDDESVYFMKNLKKSENIVELSGNVMYITKGQKDVALAMGKDAKAVVIQPENGKEKVTEFASVASAVNYLADAVEGTAVKEYDGDIFALLNSNTSAAWVVFKSNTELKTGAGKPGAGDSGEHFTAQPYIYENGFATLSVTAERPAYIATGTALNFSYDVYVNGAPYGSDNGTIAAADKTATENWDNGSSNMFLYRPIKAGDKITVENFQFTNLPAQNYVLKIVDQNGNDLSAKLAKPTNWTVSGTTAGDKWVQFATGAYGNGTFAVTKVENATYTGTLPTGVAYTALATVSGLKADTKGYVVVTVDTSALDAYAGPWAITTATGDANPNVALSNYGLAGETAVLSITGASSIANGTNFDLSGVKVALTGAPAAYKYKVTVAGMGSATVVGTTAGALSGVIKVDKNIEITKDMVSVSVVEEKMVVTGGNWNGNKLTLTFSENVGAAAESNFTWAVGTANPANSSTLNSIAVQGNTVTLTFSGSDLAAGNTVATTGSAIQGPTAANTAAAQTITLNANGTVTVA